MSLRRATIAGATILAATTVFAQNGEIAVHIASPPLVSEVPSSIPPGGVNINDQVTLMPPVGLPTLLKSRSDAIHAARKFGDPKLFPPTTLLTNFTDPGSIPPPDSPVGFRDIENRLAWVVTFTSDKPEEVGSAPFGKSAVYVSHFHVVLDADTGKFLLGFFTR